MARLVGTLHCGQHYGAAFACECLNPETAAEAWTPNLGQALLEPRLLVEIVPRHTFRFLPGRMMSVSALGLRQGADPTILTTSVQSGGDEANTPSRSIR
jgi:hypothetical protein